MIKFLGEGTKPIKQILRVENKLQPLQDPVPLKVTPSSCSSQISQSLQKVNELGKHFLLAAQEGDPAEVSALLRQGLPFASDWLGTTPLHIAAQHNRVEVCEVLLNGGIAKDARNKVDKTPLHMAVYEGHCQAAEILIRHGADINAADLLQMTPLHWAVQNGHTSLVELLLRNGADAAVQNKFSLTPQDIAHQINKLEIVELLQAYECDSQAASQALVVQLQEEDQSKSVTTVDADTSEAKWNTSPVIIVDDTTLRPGSDPAKNNKTANTPQTLEIPSTVDDITQTAEDPVSVERMEHDVQEDSDSSFSAMKLLQEHGITMLPNDDNDDSNILNSVMESGHSVVLTEVGKEMLNTVKKEEEKTTPKEKPSITVIRVTPEQFLAMNKGNLIQNITPGKLKVVSGQPSVRRVIMKKKKGPIYFENKPKPENSKRPSELESVLEELGQAKKTIEQYKLRLKRKEAEVERYKYQLKLLLDNT